MPTNQPTPVILDDEALAELERDISTCNSAVFPITVEMAAALCQTVRAAWAKYDAEDKDHRLTIDTFRQQERIWQQKFDEQEQENTALREQLAEVELARDQLSSALSVRDTQLSELQSRLAEKQNGLMVTIRLTNELRLRIRRRSIGWPK